MKILLIVDDYIPDSTKIAAKMMHELALQFIEEGNQVTVLTPCTVKKEDSDLNAINNLTIYRFLSGNIKNVSKFKRAINETLLSIRAYLSYFSILKKDKHDLIICYSPTIFFGPIVGLFWGLFWDPKLLQKETTNGTTFRTPRCRLSEVRESPRQKLNGGWNYSPKEREG